MFVHTVPTDRVKLLEKQERHEKRLSKDRVATVSALPQLNCFSYEVFPRCDCVIEGGVRHVLFRFSCDGGGGFFHRRVFIATNISCKRALCASPFSNPPLSFCALFYRVRPRRRARTSRTKTHHLTYSLFFFFFCKAPRHIFVICA